jgi:hypothetical protein
MPADYRIDLGKRRVWSFATGDLSYDDMTDHMNRLAKDPQFDPTFSQMLDFRGIKIVGLTSQQVVDLAEVRVFSRHSKRAFVAPEPTNFGLARMYEALRATKGDDHIRVFMDYDEALEWLDLEDGDGLAADKRTQATNRP